MTKEETVETIEAIRDFFLGTELENMGEKLINKVFPDTSIQLYLEKNFLRYEGKSKSYFFTSGDLSEFFLKRKGVQISANNLGRLLTALGHVAKARSVGGRVRRAYSIEPKNNIDLIMLKKIAK
jgi:hypothetical protein